MSLEANQFDPYLICFKEGKGGFPPTQASLPWLQALRSLCAVCPALASRKGRFPPSVETEVWSQGLLSQTPEESKLPEDVPLYPKQLWQPLH